MQVNDTVRPNSFIKKKKIERAGADGTEAKFATLLPACRVIISTGNVTKSLDAAR